VEGAGAESSLSRQGHVAPGGDVDGDCPHWTDLRMTPEAAREEIVRLQARIRDLEPLAYGTKPCPKCGEEFATRNPRKSYCSPRCQIASASLRYKRKQADKQ